jgi:hypothetical protein
MHVDFFNFFRYVLGTVVTIYATVVTLQSLWGWYVYFSGEGKYYSLARRYLMLHGLRVRIKTFGGDVLICILLTAVFFMLCYAHYLVSQIHPYWTHVGRIATNP